MSILKRGTTAVIATSLIGMMFIGCNGASSTANGEKGSGYNVETSVYEKQNLTIQGKQVEVNKLVKTTYECNVGSQDKDGNTKVKVKIKETYVKEERDKKIIAEYDSINGQKIGDLLASPVITVHSGAAGEEFEASFDKKGNVKEIKQNKNIVKQIMDKHKITDEKVKNKIEPVAKKEFGEEALKAKMQYIVMKDLEKSWSNKEKIYAGIFTTINSNYTLSRSEGDICYIDVTGKSDKELKTDDLLFDGMKVVYVGSCEKSGKLEVTKKDGIISKSNVLSKFKGTMEINEGPKDMKDKKIPAAIEVQTYITIKK